MPYWQNPRTALSQTGFGGGVSPVKQQGSVTPGGVAVWYDEGILVDGSAPGGLITDAPLIGGPFARQGGAWIPITGGGGAGTLTSITAGPGLTGGTITTSGTITLATPVSLANGGTGVSAGSATAALTALGGAPLNSAALTGTPTLVTPPAGTDDSNALATTAWVTTKLASATAGVSQITATTPLNASAATGNVALTLGTVPVASGGTGATTAADGLAALGGAPLLSPPLTGIPTAPTAAVATNTTQIATTAFVKAQNYLTGNEAITLSGDVTGSGATAITATLADVNSDVGTFQGITVNAKGLVTAANNQSYLTGNQTITLSGDASGSGTTAITVTLPDVNTNTGTFQGITVNAKGQVTAAVDQAYAPLASPPLTGTPTAPTATAGTDTTQVATTAFVKAAVDAIDALPTGGAIYDVLSKASATSGDVEWRGAGVRPNNEIVIGNTTGNGANTITLGGAAITALYTRAGLVLGNAPTGGAKGPGTINTTNGVYVNNVKLGGFAPSVAWVSDTNPSGVSMFINNTGRVLDIVAVSGIVERTNTVPAGVTVVKAQDNASLLLTGVPVHNQPFDADGAEGLIQDLVPASGVTLGIGERLGLRSETGSIWVDSVASITVYME